MNLLPTLVISFLAAVAHAQTSGTWSGCIGEEALVSIGNPTRVCLQVGNSVDWGTDEIRYTRASFEPPADEYSRFHIPNCT